MRGATVSSINKTDRHDITEILLKVAFKHHNTIASARNRTIERLINDAFDVLSDSLCLLNNAKESCQ
jgi:hypothetical protein